jgi:hypothetical protein
MGVGSDLCRSWRRSVACSSQWRPARASADFGAAMRPVRGYVQLQPGCRELLSARAPAENALQQRADASPLVTDALRRP